MTQSGVSQHISKLERQLGVKLLIREGKQFSVSESGAKLYREAQSILQGLENLQQSVATDSPFEGEVRVMSPGSIGLNLYPQLLSLQQQHPSLVIDYRFAPNKSVEQSIAESNSDIGLMTRKPIVPDVQSEKIASERLLLVTPANMMKPTYEDLMVLGFIDHPDGSHHADLLMSANFIEFQHSDLFPKKGFSNQISLILEPVSKGLGFTVLPAHAVEAFRYPELIRTHVLDNSVSETLYLCTRRNRVFPKRIETIKSMIKAHIANPEESGSK
ncbi:putative Transcriptional regulator (LysR family) protein [Oceanobacter sp. RED65]|uniref:Putative Transcriptional regulator (LysR family) protein n=2 Tax=Bermanella marisrubri TaxID=207949 RepID=Q1N6C9_9GAMM|nr:putative Transcriptional regulator (LysR family) protein [Oceanobacter sp. RED65] [Bermanella marisrubri]